MGEYMGIHHVFKMLATTTVQMARKMCTAAAEKVETKIAEKAPLAYSRAASIHHWAVGGALLGTIGCVLKCQQSPKEEKGAWMFRHKSLGLLTGLLVLPRLATKLTSVSPGRLPGGHIIEHYAAQASHYALYAFTTIMPVTGIAMGYFGGKGLPFFFTTLPGASTPTGAYAGQAFKIHKTLGTYGKYLVPLHSGAAFFHVARGQPIFFRINPFK